MFAHRIDEEERCSNSLRCNGGWISERQARLRQPVFSFLRGIHTISARFIRHCECMLASRRSGAMGSPSPQGQRGTTPRMANERGPEEPAAQDLAIASAIEGVRGRLWSFIHRRVPDPFDAEDILQDVFCELVVAYRLMKPIEEAGAWMVRVARNRIIDLVRRKKAVSLDQAIGAAEDGSTPEARESPPVSRRRTGFRVRTPPADRGVGRRARRADPESAGGLPRTRVRGPQFSRARGGDWFERERIVVTQARSGETAPPPPSDNLRRTAQQVGRRTR
jgi:RNA polymerase sigma factor (sigma-70 family)